MIKVYLDEKESIIEAMLFASGNVVRGIDIADVLNVDEKDVREFVNSINNRFDNENFVKRWNFVISRVMI